MNYQSGRQQGGLFDYQERKELLRQQATPLDRLNEHLDWELFRLDLEGHLDYRAGAQGGRPPWCPVLMFKILVLQKYYALSEEQTQFQILDRFSCQRFLGLDVGDPVPDKNSIWTFKERLGEKGLRACFDLFDEVLRESGLLASRGRIVDASFVEVPRQRNRREENAQIKAGHTPEAWKEQPARLAQKDVDARWTKKHGQSHYGYKNHLKGNARTKLIEDYAVTDASVHDSQVLEQLLDESDGRLHADSAYRSARMGGLLQERGIQNRIHEKGCRGRPLTEKQPEANRKKSRVRARGEHIFGFQVYQMGANWIRTIGRKRAERGIGLGHVYAPVHLVAGGAGHAVPGEVQRAVMVAGGGGQIPGWLRSGQAPLKPPLRSPQGCPAGPPESPPPAGRSRLFHGPHGNIPWRRNGLHG